MNNVIKTYLEGSDVMLNVDPNYTIHLTRGDTARFSVSIDNLVTNKNYEVSEQDMITLTVKKKTTDAETLIQKTVVGGNLIHIEPEDTSGLDFGKYLYDVQLTTSTGDVYTVIPPTTFEILKEVTY